MNECFNEWVKRKPKPASNRTTQKRSGKKGAKTGKGGKGAKIGKRRKRTENKTIESSAIIQSQVMIPN